MKLARAVNELRPDTGYSIEGSEPVWETDTDGVEILANITWFEPNVQRLTREVVEAKLASIPDDSELFPSHHMDRMSAYPPIADFVDAYYHAEKTGDKTLMQEYISKVDAVKLKYPKV